jgi:hypothetical protein
MENTVRSVGATRLGIGICTSIICLAVACTEGVNSEYDREKSCFTEESVKTLPWLKPVLENFEKPKGGGYRLILRVYREEYFVVIANPLVSSPMSYIFNCEGKTISDLGIGYDEFYDGSEFVAEIACVKPL